MQQIKIPHNKGIALVMADSIIRIEAMSNYSKVHFDKDCPLVVAKVLHWFQDKLPSEMFARVNRSQLVNKNFMKEISGPKQKTLTLSNGDLIVMSHSRKKEMLHKKYIL